MTAVIISGSFFFSGYLQVSLAKKEAFRTADALGEATFNSMYPLMRRGWSREELVSFVAGIQSAYEKSPYELHIYRGNLVEQLFGAIPNPPIDDIISHAFIDGEKIIKEGDGFVRSAYPLKAEPECLRCHTNALPGDVLGVIDISTDFSQTLSTLRNRDLFLYAITIPFALLMAFFASRYIARRVQKNVDSFTEHVGKIHSVKDFREMEFDVSGQNFRELAPVNESIRLLAEKLKQVAVDREILEFEVRLLDKFVITSNVINDWQEYVKTLLREINHVIETYSLFTMFRTGENTFELLIFWRGMPDEISKALFEELAFEAVKHSPHLDLNANYTIQHIIDSDEPVPTLSKESIQHATKSLFLEAPRIGGIVGIGVQSSLASDPVRNIVIESILTTLINLVGSVKAIHKYTKELEHYTTKDPLTGLLNQRVFRDILDTEIARANRHEYPFAVIMMDLDNFKSVNDRYGHAFGDDLIQKLSTVITDQKRAEDVLARHDGDRFALLLSRTGEAEASMVIERIIDAVRRFTLSTEQGATVSVTVSAGAAFYPEHATDAGELYTIADGMLHRAKKEGKNTLRLPEGKEVADVLKDRREKSLMVLNAIKEQRIVPYFQPILDLRTSEIGIHELLMRIETENRLINAQEFIDIAEKIGVIHQMDYIVIEKAFAHIHETGYDGLLFVNLSPRSLIIGEFIQHITDLAERFHIKNENIIFEITERETVKNFQILDKFVHHLKEKGFKFAIDDFGSGFSSFHYIKKFPVDYLKIDGEFILNLRNDSKDLAFVKSIVSLSRELGIYSIAEFVEDRETLEFLKIMGTDYAQGFEIAYPGPKLTV